MAAAQPPATSKRAQGGVANLDAVLQPIRNNHKLVALGGAIVKGDKLIGIGAVGVRKEGSDVKITINDQWHIGSCTKAMTATLCAMLVEKGKLSWNSTLAGVFPDLKPKMHADYRDVTLEQLLTNRAGVPADISGDGLWAKLWKLTTPPADQRRTLLEGVVSKPPVHKPGTAYLYSNQGFAIAGAMAERVMQKPYEDLMQEMLFKPLHMDSAGFGAPGKPGDVLQPWGHTAGRLRTKPIEPGKKADNPEGITPAGRVHCSLADWAKFIGLHVQGESGAARLLKPETYRKLHGAIGDEQYAMGWGVTERPWGGRVLTHAGSNTMWYCVTWISPEKNFAVLVTCNQAGGDTPQACDEAAWALIQHHLKIEKPEHD